MTGFEPAAIAATAGITAAASGLTKIAVEIFKDTSGGVLDRLRSGIDEQTRTFIFQAFERYIGNYRYRHCQLKVLGMRQPVDLEEVYTSVRLLDSEGISAFESLEALEKAYREQRRRQSTDSREKAKPGVKLAKAEQYLMVLGSPGAGKSTFLRKMGLEALKGNKGGLKHRCIPVFIELKRLTKSNIDLKKLIVQEFETCNFPRAAEFTNRALRQGRLLILLDGLDEVPTDNLTNAIRTIQDFVDQHRTNRFIASCRIAAYRTSFRQFTDVAMADFDDIQIEQFISNWFSSPEDWQAKKAQTCWEVLQRPENKAAKELAQTPLLLTFLCLVYGRAQRFPENRAQLYGKALRILLEEWAADKGIMQAEIYDGLSTELEEVLLAEIACKGFIKDQLFFTQRELVDAIKNFLAGNLNAPQHFNGQVVLKNMLVQQGIFIERADDAYSFSHLTLQEYLTAQYIVDHQRIGQLVNDHLFDERWHEVFLLVPGLMRGGAEALLLQIEEKVHKQINTPKLKALLTWADQATANSASSYQPMTKRALAIFLTLALAFAWDFNIGLGLAYYHANALAWILERDRVRVRDHARILNLTQVLGSDITIPDRDFKTSLVLTRAFESLAIFRTASFDELEKHLLKLMLQFKTQSRSDESDHKAANDLFNLWCDTLQINPKVLALSEEEKVALSQYFYANTLMVKCKEAAVRVSPEVWAEIEERMITVRE
ncbi:MAG: NACHT domain-containing protein [Leptolyngbya sp. SIOISBB]|nr:NACHT domain-containing protein [Leptolyngbya sp. SIOISBB]